MPTVQTFAPDPVLARDVQRFWTFEQESTEIQRGPILPDAHVELIFKCGGAQVLDSASGQCIEMPPVVLNGLQRSPFRWRIKGACQFTAVRLNAWAMRHFVDLPDKFGVQPTVELTGIWKRFAPTLVAAVHRHGYQEGVACLQQFLLDIRRSPAPALASIRTAAEMLDATYGNVDLSDLAKRSGLSPRQLERQFKYSTGVSPKTYARLLRHETARLTLSRNPRTYMVALAQDLGYTDQAHFIHDFKAFTSYTPGQYVTQMKMISPQSEFASRLSPQQTDA